MRIQPPHATPHTGHAQLLTTYTRGRAGALRCVLWGVRDRAGQKAGACEAYIATLSLQEPPADPAGTAAGATGPVPAAGELGVVGLQLVARSSLPPQSVVPSAEHDAVLLGVDPSQWDAEDNELAGGSSQQPQQQAAANGAARGAQPQGAGTAPAANGTGAGAMEEDVEHIECRRGLGGWVLWLPCARFGQVMVGQHTS